MSSDRSPRAIALDHLDDAHLDRDVRGHQRVHLPGHGAVGGGEFLGRDVVVDGAGVVLPRHLRLRHLEPLQRRDHLAHGVLQFAHLVGRPAAEVERELAARDGLGRGHGVAQRPGHQAANGEPDGHAQHEDREPAEAGQDPSSACSHPPRTRFRRSRPPPPSSTRAARRTPRSSPWARCRCASCAAAGSVRSPVPAARGSRGCRDAR